MSPHYVLNRAQTGHSSVWSLSLLQEVEIIILSSVPGWKCAAEKKTRHSGVSVAYHLFETVAPIQISHVYPFTTSSKDSRVHPFKTNIQGKSFGTRVKMSRKIGCSVVQAEVCLFCDFFTEAILLEFQLNTTSNHARPHFEDGGGTNDVVLWSS